MKLVETEQDIYFCSNKRDAQGINLLRLQKDQQEKKCYFGQWHLSLFRLFGELSFVKLEEINELETQDVALNNKWKTEDEEWN